MTTEIVLPPDLTLPPAKILKAGALECLYEAGNLRYISISKTELVRKVYGAVRNNHWTTIPFKIKDEMVQADDKSFVISYTAIYGQGEDIYQADYLIEGKVDNTISFSMKGLALADFKRNRIGLCLHHPLKECKGRLATVTRPEGTVYQSSFPDLVSPDLPFQEMHQLEWISEDGISVQLIFDGDVFETEDQRNWSDGSFKTYSTRSSIPMPVDVKRGDSIDQKITIRISGSGKLSSTESQPVVTEVKVPFPQIGYCRSHGGPSLDSSILDWLIKIPFDHYRVTIVMNHHVWRHQLTESLTEAALINTKLELVIFFSDDYKNEALQLIELIKEKQLLVESILVLQKHHNVSTPEILENLYPVIKKELPAVKVGYGTDAIFVDVNQSRPGDAPFDFISFGLQPQAHAFDNRSILENLQSQPYIIRTAMAISAAQPVHISPITLKDRDSGADERQYSYMFAIWTLIAIQNFSEAYSITFYDLFGDKGLLHVTTQQDATTTIKPSAVYDVLATIFNFQPVWVIKKFIGDELLMDGLLLENDHGDRLWLKAPDEYKFAVGIR